MVESLYIDVYLMFISKIEGDYETGGPWPKGHVQPSPTIKSATCSNRKKTSTLSMSHILFNIGIEVCDEARSIVFHRDSVHWIDLQSACPGVVDSGKSELDTARYKWR